MLRRFTGLFLTGLFTILPFVITIAVMGFVASKLYSWFGPTSGFGRGMSIVTDRISIPIWLSYLISFVLVVSLITLLGYLARNFVGQRTGIILNLLISRIPIFNKVYSSVEQVVEMIHRKDGEAAVALSNVVLARLYNTYVLGLLASSEPILIQGVPHYMVYVPGSPMLATGNNYLIPCSEVLDADVSIEEITRMIFSLGSLTPGIMNAKDPLILPTPKQVDQAGA